MTAAGAAGTAAFQIGGALGNFQTLASAGAAYGDTFSYVINDGSNWEIGEGTYAASSGNYYVERTPTLTSAGNATPLSLSSAAICTTTIRAADLGLPVTQNGTGLTGNINLTASGGITVSEGSKGISMAAASGAGSGRPGLGVLYVPAPTPPYTLRAKISAAYSSSNNAGVSIGWYDGSSKLHMLALVANAGAAPHLEFQKWSNATTFVANDNTWANGYFNQALAYPIWLAVEMGGTSFNLYVSLDGGYYSLLGNYSTSAAYLGASGYTNLAFALNLCENAMGGALLEWAFET